MPRRFSSGTNELEHGPSHSKRILQERVNGVIHPLIAEGIPVEIGGLVRNQVSALFRLEFCGGICRGFPDKEGVLAFRSLLHDLHIRRADEVQMLLQIFRKLFQSGVFLDDDRILEVDFHFRREECRSGEQKQRDEETMPFHFFCPFC